MGVSIGEAIIAIVLPQKLAAIPDAASLGLGNTVSELIDSVDRVRLITVCRKRVVPFCDGTESQVRIPPFVMRCYARGRNRLRRYGL